MKESIVSGPKTQISKIGGKNDLVRLQKFGISNKEDGESFEIKLFESIQVGLCIKRFPRIKTIDGLKNGVGFTNQVISITQIDEKEYKVQTTIYSHYTVLFL